MIGLGTIPAEKMKDIILITELWYLMNFYIWEITEIILYGNVIVHTHTLYT